MFIASHHVIQRAADKRKLYSFSVCNVRTRNFPPGIIGAVARDFFNSDITMEIVNRIEELERTGKKEHVVFLVTQRPFVTNPASSGENQPRTPSEPPRSHTRRNAMHLSQEVQL